VTAPPVTVPASDPLPHATGEAVIRDPTGLHARPAVKLTKLAKSFEAGIRVRGAANGAWVNAKSPNAMMKLKARHGETLVFAADGADAAAAVAALVALVERNFDD
jgi:phosphocarrier protein HPr